jgi:hypothetical protein
MTEPNISVLLVDDHSLVRRGFRRMLEDDPSIRVVGEAEDGHQAVQLAAELKPQVVVMDFAMPSMKGGGGAPFCGGAGDGDPDSQYARGGFLRSHLPEAGCGTLKTLDWKWWLRKAGGAGNRCSTSA